MSEESKWPNVKKYLESGIYQNCNEQDFIYLDEYEIESLVKVILNEYKEKNNIGLFIDRTKYTSGSSELELNYSKEWYNINKINAGVNYGNGILQDLFIRSKNDPLRTTEAIFNITNRERQIVATVIQWLGSNIGSSFVEKVLNKSGYKIIKSNQ